jgi:hypothetical protein
VGEGGREEGREEGGSKGGRETLLLKDCFSHTTFHTLLLTHCFTHCSSHTASRQVRMDLLGASKSYMSHELEAIAPGEWAPSVDSADSAVDPYIA